jgi:antibiotic biosynthesis monooxygenase (ABM) superfamily enzyme
MRELMDNRAPRPPWRMRLAMTLLAWVVAFGLVMTLLSVFGDQLSSLPLALRALVISGVLVTAMTNLVMPALSVAVRRWLLDNARQRARSDHEPKDQPNHEPTSSPSGTTI